MSDHVRYIVGNTPGRDHSNWPTILRSEIEKYFPPIGLTTTERDEIWPVDISLEALMAISWRVRKWKLTGNINVAKSVNNGVELGTNSATGAATLRESNIYLLKEGDLRANREFDIVGQVGTQFNALINNGIGPENDDAPISDWTQHINNSLGGSGTFSGSTRPGGVSDPFTSILELKILSGPGLALFDEVTSQFSPPCAGLGKLIDGFAVPLNASAVFSRDLSTVTGGTTPMEFHVPISMTVVPRITPNFLIPMQLRWRFVVEGIGKPTTGGGSGAFRLEAVEFWEHDGTYDSGTGAELLNPFR